MSTTIHFFSGIARLSAIALLPVSLTYAQSELHPQAGDHITYFPINLTLADTGVVVNMATWDFSGTVYEPNDSLSYTIRVLTAGESAAVPEATIAEDCSDGSKHLYRDSITYLKEYQYVNPAGTISTFVEPATSFTFPIQLGDAINTTAEYTYFGGTQFDVFITNETFVRSSGTLITPLETFNNVQLITAHYIQDYYIDDTTLYTTVHKIETKWVSESENAVLLSMMWNDLNNLTTSRFRSDVSSLSLAEKRLSDILVYPNPATTSVQLSESVESYWLIDNAGRTVLTGKGSIIDLNGIANGNYRLQFEQDGVLLNRSLQVNK